MTSTDTVRIDKYLWAIRVFKTRSEATEACKGGKVRTGGDNAKPSKLLKEGDVVTVRKGSAVFTYKVLKVTESRIGAKLVPEYAEDLTPREELDKQHAPVETFFLRRDRGAGRPTKKDRRDMEQLWEGIGFGADDAALEDIF